MATAQENIMVNFEVNYEALDTAQDKLVKLGKVDASAFSKIQNAITDTATDTQGLIKTFKDVGTASIKMGKSVENAFGAGIQDALDEAGVSVKEFEQALKKTTQPAVSLKKEMLQLKEALARMKAEGKDAGKEFEALRARAGKLADAISDANQEIKNAGSDTRGLDNVVGSISAVAGGYAAVQGAAALFGEENEDLQKSLLKVNGAMALASGAQQLLNGLQKEGALIKLKDSIATGAQTAALSIYTFITNGATLATKLLRAAFIATGIGAIVVLLISAYQAMTSFGDSTKETTKEIDKFSLAVDASKESLDRFISSQNNASDIAIEKAKQRGATEAQINKMVVDGIRETAKETDKIAKQSLTQLNTFAKEVGSNIGISLGANAFQEFQGRAASAYDILLQIKDLKISGEFDKLSKSSQDSVNSLEAAANKINDIAVESRKLNADANLKEQQFITKQFDEKRKKQEEFNKLQKSALDKALKDAEAQENEAAKNSIQRELDRVNKEIDQEQIKFDNLGDLQAEDFERKMAIGKMWDEEYENFLDSEVENTKKAAAELKKIEEEKRAAMIATINTIVDAASRVAGVFNEISALRTAKDQEEIASQRRKVAEQLAGGVITQKAAEARQKQIDVMERKAKTEQARRDKAAAVFASVLAIPKAFLQGLSTGGPVLGAVYAALAAVEAALIASRPVPKFFRGKRDSYEGPGVVADMGSELVERGGRMFLYTKPTQTYLGARDKVYTAAETKRIMHNSSLSTTPMRDSQPVFDYGKFAAAIPKDSININIDKDFISESVANGLSRTNYMDRRYSSRR